MISLQGISKGFGPQVLFEELDWDIKPGHRIGLVGPNGAGKTTLFSIVTGEILPDSGQVRIARDFTVGYLPQEIALLGGRSIREEARRGLETVLRLGAELEDMGFRLGEVQGAELDDLLEQYDQLQARFEALGGFTAENRVEEILTGLGFRPGQFDRDCGELSGGWQMRVALARLLLMRPSALLLDEPTNHLDLESLVWLEGFLKYYPGTVVAISHDRSFLNGLCTDIAELSSAGLRQYPGDFEDYLAQVELRQSQLERQAKNQDRKLAELERFVERFRYKASKARQVQSRIKVMGKMDRVELESQARTIHFHLPAPPRSGRVVMQLTNVRKAYGAHVVYEGLDVELLRGTKLALVGPNGAGKSTLLKLLAGRLTADHGEVEIGDQTRPYYFAQHQVESLDLKQTVFEEAQSAAPGQSMTFIRSILGAFLFSGEDVEKRVGVLSGGEKNRLALAKMLLTPANVLLLDEPTNHLDMASRSVLEAALGEYTGTVVIISHDRHFMDGVVEEVWEVDACRVTPYLGNYSEHLARKATGALPEPFPLHVGAARTSAPRKSHNLPAASVAPAPVPAKKVARLGPTGINWGGGSDVARRPRRDDKRSEAEVRQRRSSATRDLKQKVDSTLGQVTSLEERLDGLRGRQAEPSHYASPDEVRETARAVVQADAELASAYAEWEAAAAELERVERSFEE
ncbi:MAG: ABC-F family ATP-binding cassette domain-containing protein [Myxococcales bacterium]|nr:ABC-F family ATP-binding cassette domain-containing protein [Myxococcales bacterium]